MVGDVVVRGGRVVDPESGLDRSADVLVKGGRIAAIGDGPYESALVLEATGLVVAPGFIDLHSHAQNVPSMYLQAQDGVTSALELEAGVRDVGRASRAASSVGRPVHYGFAASWAAARMRALDGLEETGQSDFDFTVGMEGRRWRDPAGERLVHRILGRLEEEVAQGAVGIGVLLGYAPDTHPAEFSAVAGLGERLGVGLFTHARSKAGDGPHPLAGIEEIVRVSAQTGAHVHACHLNSTCLRTVEQAHDLVRAAARDGARLTTEMYPYGAGMTAVSAPFLAPERLPELGLEPCDLVVAATREVVVDAERLRRMRDLAPRTLVLIHYLDERAPEDAELLARAISGDDVVVASDAIPFVDGRGLTVEAGDVVPAGARTHPRGVGTFARFLRLARTKGHLSLQEALRRCSLLPAQILEPAVPAMKRKGRLQIGCDADLVAFSASEVTDRATYANACAPSVGFRHVLVGGTTVVRDGVVDYHARPGRWLRGAV